MQPSNHLSPDVLSLYVLGRLAWDQVAPVERHLDDCDSCQSQVRSLEHSADSFVALLRGPLPGPAQAGGAIGQLIARAQGLPAAGARGARRPVPESVAGLEIIQELVAGGLGVVYLANNPGLDRRQAVKLLLPEHRGNVDLVARFQREKRAIARIKDKQHVVEIFDAGCDAAAGPYLVMEYLDGASLKQLLSRHGPLPAAEACELVRQAALGLQAAHDLALVHRDVKPSNLMLARFGADKVGLKAIDYGLVKEVGGPSSSAPEATSAGAVIGTPDFMAPEQAGIWSKLPVGPAADVYSLGCTLYTLLNGRPPFDDRPLMEKLKGHATEPCPNLNRSDLSPEVLALMNAMLDKNPRLRPAAREVVQRLAPFRCDAVRLRVLLDASASEPIALLATTPMPARRRRRRWLAFAAAGVALVVAGLVVVNLPRFGTAPPVVETSAPGTGNSTVAPPQAGPAPGGLVRGDGPGKSLKGGTYKVDDLKVTLLQLPAKGLLPCMLWADAEGSAFLSLEGDTGVLRRIAFPDCKVTKQKDLDRKFAWMALSAEGLLLSDSDSGKVWVLDPATLEVKSKIAVLRLKRATSAPGLSWAVARDRAPHNSQLLYVVDLRQKTATPWAVPQALRSTIGLENPANKALDQRIRAALK